MPRPKPRLRLPVDSAPRKAATSDPMAPGAALLTKLGSIVVHVEEARSARGHAFDWHTVDSLMSDPELQAWLSGMREMALLPVKR